MAGENIKLRDHQAGGPVILYLITIGHKISMVKNVKFDFTKIVICNIKQLIETHCVHGTKVEVYKM